MNRDTFESKIRLLLTPKEDDPEYELHMDQMGEALKGLIWDTEQKSGGDGMWNEDVAAENYKQFHWLHTN